MSPGRFLVLLLGTALVVAVGVAVVTNPGQEALNDYIKEGLAVDLEAGGKELADVKGAAVRETKIEGHFVFSTADVQFVTGQKVKLIGYFGKWRLQGKGSD
jgi:hypothetical protein